MENEADTKKESSVKNEPAKESKKDKKEKLDDKKLCDDENGKDNLEKKKSSDSDKSREKIKEKHSLDTNKSKESVRKKQSNESHESVKEKSSNESSDKSDKRRGSAKDNINVPNKTKENVKEKHSSESNKSKESVKEKHSNESRENVKEKHSNESNKSKESVKDKYSKDSQDSNGKHKEGLREKVSDGSKCSSKSEKQKESIKEKGSNASEKQKDSVKKKNSGDGSVGTPDDQRRRSSGRSVKMELLGEISEDSVFIDISGRMRSRQGSEASSVGTPRTPRKNASMRQQNGRVHEICEDTVSEIIELSSDSPNLHKNVRRHASSDLPRSPRRASTRRKSRRESDRRRSIKGERRTADRRLSTAGGEPGSRRPSLSRKGSGNGNSAAHAEIMRRQSHAAGPYMSAGLANSYRTPGAEILVASLIITVGLVALIVSFASGRQVWMIVGAVCMAFGGLFLMLGLCWYFSGSSEKDQNADVEMRVVTAAEIAERAKNPYASPKRKRKSGPIVHV